MKLVKLYICTFIYCLTKRWKTWLTADNITKVPPRKFLCLEISSYGLSASNTDEKKKLEWLSPCCCQASWLGVFLELILLSKSIAKGPSFGLMLNQYLFLKNIMNIFWYIKKVLCQHHIYEDLIGLFSSYLIFQD